MAFDEIHTLLPTELRKPGDTGRDKVTVIIVNYNSGELLGKALQSLSDQTRRPDEVIIVDNDSTDGSVEQVHSEHHPHIRILRADRNIGFAAASNLAAQMASSHWLAMLNCDATADKNWLSEMLNAQKRHEDVQFFASAQVQMDNPNSLDGAGDVFSITGLSWRGGYRHPSSSLPLEGRCFGACAAGAFLSRELFLQLGGFEDRFFCYLEDVDFSYRAQLSGHDCIFVPSARIRHKGSACSDNLAWPMRMSARNRTDMLIRNTPLLLALLTWPLILIGAVLGWLHGVRHGNGCAVLQGYWEATRRLGPALRDRKRLSTPLCPPLSLIRAVSWNPFAVFRRTSKVRELNSSALGRSAFDNDPAPVNIQMPKALNRPKPTADTVAT